MLLKAVNRFQEHPILGRTIETWESYIGFSNYLRASILKYRALKKLNRI
jgi:hypothetical protein